jgi:gliding motility-associated-like protein
VAYDVSDKLAVRTLNEGSNFQLITNTESGSGFKILNVDTLGVVSNLNSVGSQTDNQDSNIGFMAAGFDSLIAQGVVIGGQNFIEVFVIDASGGMRLQNRINLNIPAPPTVYGLTFYEGASPMLYATLSGPGQTSYLLQIPLYLVNDIDISANINVIAVSSTEEFGALQAGPVNPNSDLSKDIYMAVNGKDKIAYIQEPQYPGNAAVVAYIDVSNGIQLNGTSGLGLPTVTYAAQNQDGSGISASYSGNCFNSSTELNIQNICDPLTNKVEWEFEDGTTMNGQNVIYTFPKLGWNKIKVSIKIFNASPVQNIVNNPIVNRIVNLTQTECETIVLEDSIYIKPSPEISFSPPYYVCLRNSPVEPVVISPDVSGGNTFNSLWKTTLGAPLVLGPNDSVQNIIIADTYVLEVENNYKCKSEKDILVESGCIPEVEFPTAFTPGGQNPKFSFYFKHTDNPLLKIYNRWGEIVYETDDLIEPWDGTFKGSPVSTGVYPFVLTYDALDFPNWGRQKEVGSVWILR